MSKKMSFYIQINNKYILNEDIFIPEEESVNNEILSKVIELVINNFNNYEEYKSLSENNKICIVIAKILISTLYNQDEYDNKTIKTKIIEELSQYFNNKVAFYI